MSAGVAPEPWLTPARDYPKAPPGVCILVVDCDPTSLMVVSGMLKALEYQGIAFFGLFYLHCS